MGERGSSRELSLCLTVCHFRVNTAGTDSRLLLGSADTREGEEGEGRGKWTERGGEGREEVNKGE